MRISPYSRLVCCVAALLLWDAGSRATGAEPLGGMRLLEGYVHQPLQGIDSIVGKISKKDGLEMTYEIGSLPQPGGFRLGGQFSDRAQQMPKEQVQWYREQTVNGQPVHLAHTKDDLLLASFPQKGMNISVVVRTPNEMADALLMILTYPGPVAKASPK